MSIQECMDTSEAIALEASLGLYLKPSSKIKISVQLPKLKIPGQSISSWQVMEKLKGTVRPDQFIFLKALKITPAVIKLEGELETRASCERALARLKAAGGFRLNGFSEWLQIRAAHATGSGPTRHDWDAFFRDARGVDEMKPGERPDTVHLQDLPVRWFSESLNMLKPSEKLLRKAFVTFGRIRRLEIPFNLNWEEKAFGKSSFLHRDLIFEAYIQYEEYVEFATAMDSLRGKKLLYKDSDGKMYSADIKVDFDRTNYLSERCIKKRAAEAKKSLPSTSKHEEVSGASKDSHINSELLKANVNTKKMCEQTTVETKKEAEMEAKLLLKELLMRSEDAERKREIKIKKQTDEARINQLQAAQREKLEEIKRQKRKDQERLIQLERKNHEKLIQQERILKEKLLKNLKAKKEQKIIEVREQLRKDLAGRKILKSVLANTSSKLSYI